MVLEKGEVVQMSVCCLFDCYCVDVEEWVDKREDLSLAHEQQHEGRLEKGGGVEG